MSEETLTLTLKELCKILGRHEGTVRPKLENKYYFSNITSYKENGTRYYAGITQKNIQDLADLHKYKRTK